MILIKIINYLNN